MTRSKVERLDGGPRRHTHDCGVHSSLGICDCGKRDRDELATALAKDRLAEARAQSQEQMMTKAAPTKAELALQQLLIPKSPSEQEDAYRYLAALLNEAERVVEGLLAHSLDR